MSYTPSNISATLGLLGNSGFDLSFITGKVSGYNSATLPARFKDVVAASVAMNVAINTSTILGFGGSYLPGIIGSMPAAYVGTLGAASTLSDRMLTQAQTIFPGGDISSFVQNLSKASGTASITGDLFRTANTLVDRPFSDYGPLEKFSDLGTGGLGQLSSVSNSVLDELGESLKTLGDSFDLESLQKSAEAPITGDPNFNSGSVDQLYDPDPMNNSVKYADNAIKRGAGYIAGLEEKINAALDGNSLTDFENNKFAKQKVTEVLTSITNPRDIGDFKSVLGIADSVQASNLNDLLQFSQNDPALSSTVNKETIDQITGILKSIPGGQKTKSFDELGTMVGSFKDIPAMPTLDARTTFFTSAELSSLKGYIPIFDNDDVGPTTADMIGVVSGGPAGTALDEAKVGATNAATTTEGSTILTLLDELYIDLTTDPADDYTANSFPTSGKTIGQYKTEIETEMSTLMSSSNGFDQSIVAATGTQFGEAARQVSNQVTSLSRMGTDLTQVSAGAKLPIIAFGRSIGDMAKDPANEAILLKLCSSNAAGEALRLHILEKQNITLMQKFNLSPTNVIQIPKYDPDDFSF